MPASWAIAASAASSFFWSSGDAPGGYLPTAVGLPNLSAKIIQKVMSWRLKNTGQKSLLPRPKP